MTGNKCTLACFVTLCLDVFSPLSDVERERESPSSSLCWCRSARPVCIYTYKQKERKVYRQTAGTWPRLFVTPEGISVQFSSFWWTFFFRPLRPCLSIFDATIILERIQIFLFFIHRTVFPVVTKCRSLFSGCDDGKHNGISTYPPLTRRASTFPHWCEGHTGARYSIYTNWANSWQLNHVMFIISFHSVCRFLASYCHGYYYRIGRRGEKKVNWSDRYIPWAQGWSPDRSVTQIPPYKNKQEQ